MHVKNKLELGSRNFPKLSNKIAEIGYKNFKMYYLNLKIL